MPATLIEEDGGKRTYIQLSDVTFWVGAGGLDWLSFGVGRATASEYQGATETEIPVVASVERDGPKSPQGDTHGRAILQVAGHRFRLLLPTLTSKLEFVEDAPK
jgi:hypothetical protein